MLIAGTYSFYCQINWIGNRRSLSHGWEKQWPRSETERRKSPFQFTVYATIQLDAKDEANLKFIKKVETVVTKLWKLL